MMGFSEDEVNATCWEALTLTLMARKRHRAQIDAWVVKHLRAQELSLQPSGALEWTEDVDWQGLLDLVCPDWRRLA